MRAPVILMVLALAVGAWMLGRFFFASGTTGDSGELKEVVASQKVAAPAISAAGSLVTSASGTQPTTAAANGSTLIAVGKHPLGAPLGTPPYPSTL